MKKYLLLLIIGLLGGIVFNWSYLQNVFASSTSNFSQTINTGSLSVDIVDASYVTVASPAVAMEAATFSFVCQDATGTFGTNTERIYVKNPDAADAGWTASLAAANLTDVWDSAGTDFDFNDPGGSGCADTTDANDADLVGGQMTVNPSVGTLNIGQCASCVITNVSKGSSASFDAVAGSPVNSITILDATATSNDIGDWRLTGVAITQKVPAEQPAAADYNINMVLSIVAK